MVTLAPSWTRAQEAREWLTRGQAHFDRQEFEQAAEAFERATEAAPDEAEPHFLLGLTYARLRDYPRAAAALLNARDRDPDLEGLPRELGVALYRIESYEAAAEALEGAVELEPDNAVARYYLGLARYQLGEYQAAIEELARARELEPEFTTAVTLYTGLAWFRAGRYREARDSFARLVTASPGSEEANLARRYLETIEERLRGPKRWSLQASAGVEYNDNVTTSAVETITGEPDVAAVFTVSAEVKPLLTPTWEAALDYNFFLTVYEALKAQNIEAHTPGLTLTFRQDPWEFALRYAFDYIYLSSSRDGLLRIQNLSPTVSVLATPTLYTQVRYRFQDKDFFTSPGRTGTNNGVGITQYVFFDGGKGYVSGTYRYELENTRSPDFDYQGHRPGLSLRLPLPLDIRFDLNLEYFVKQYRHVDSTAGNQRHDERWGFSTRFSRPVAAPLRLTLEYSYTNNHSTIRSFTYRENIVGLNLTASF